MTTEQGRLIDSRRQGCRRTIQYFDDVVHTMGNKKDVARFFRLFMVPGKNHCDATGGPGPDNFDLLSALEAWVEGGVAPDSLLASSAGPEVFTRLLCSYPAVAVYDGVGDPDDAASFRCKDRGLGHALKGFQSGG